MHFWLSGFWSHKKHFFLILILISNSLIRKNMASTQIYKKKSLKQYLCILFTMECILIFITMRIVSLLWGFHQIPRRLNEKLQPLRNLQGLTQEGPSSLAVGVIPFQESCIKQIKKCMTISGFSTILRKLLIFCSAVSNR